MFQNILRTKKFKVGYVPQYGGFFNDLTLNDNLKAISEIVIKDKNVRQERIDYLLSKFEFENVKNIKAKSLSVVKKKLVISLSLLSDPKVLLLDECFAALDVLTINVTRNYSQFTTGKSNYNLYLRSSGKRFISMCRCCNDPIIEVTAQDTPTNLVKNINAQNAYFEIVLNLINN